MKRKMNKEDGEKEVDSASLGKKGGRGCRGEPSYSGVGLDRPA